MAGLIFEGLDAATVRANLDRARDEIARAAAVAGRAADEVEVLAAVKYIPADELAVLAEAGIELVGENRAQELEHKAGSHPGRFTWDFIGQLQSRKVKQILPHVRYIHSVASDSVLAQLAKHAPPGTEVFVEVNVAGETGKSGVAPDELLAFLERSPVTVVGLMTMPPLARSPEDNRAHFAALRELADGHGLPQLSMGTSQDYVVAVEEGATIVRLGTCLYTSGAP
ncbi:MAG: YggS family pyridoxal phosphate enzyme [Actinomycetota bacterium]|nr:YggS family pyridoxal phosphate enzyme [Actinomycetota bacterium]